MHKKKSLIQYEMRTMSWFLLAGVLAALFFCFVLYMELLDWHDYAYWNSEMTGTAFGSNLSNALEKGTLLAIPCLAIMAIVQFGDTHRRKTQEKKTPPESAATENLCCWPWQNWASAKMMPKP